MNIEMCGPRPLSGVAYGLIMGLTVGMESLGTTGKFIY